MSHKRNMFPDPAKKAHPVQEDNHGSEKEKC